MPRHPAPIDAKAAKKLLRGYAIAIPLTTLVGGWCTLLQLAWVALPAGAVNHIPLAVRAAAAVVAVVWLVWLYRTFKRLPALIDEILERGLSLSADHTSEADHWLGRPGNHE